MPRVCPIYFWRDLGFGAYGQRSRAGQRDNGIAITHTKTQQTKMNVHVNAALTVSVCGHLPMVKCPSGVSGPICPEILSWLGVIGLLDVLPST